MSRTQGTTLRAAVVQMDVTLGNPNRNHERIIELLEQARGDGAKLVVFPECALTGYCMMGLEEGLQHAWRGIDACDFISGFCSKYGIVAIFGYLEKCWRNHDPASGEMVLHNSAFVTGPATEGPSYVVVNYRKSHLPVLGIDKWVTPGNRLEVVPTAAGNIGPLICYDIRFPEAARCLGLMGADIIALPTNWPEGAESSPDFLTRARAWENRVYILAANRVGVERGRRFIGRSQIVAPSGEILCEAGADEETILYADLDLAQARQKRIVIEPGEWELDTFGGRRPELYSKLTERD